MGNVVTEARKRRGNRDKRARGVGGREEGGGERIFPCDEPSYMFEERFRDRLCGEREWLFFCCEKESKAVRDSIKEMYFASW